MKTRMEEMILPVVLTFCVTLSGLAQTIISTRAGNWNDPSVWGGGTVPTPTSTVVVEHIITISESDTATIERLQVPGEVILSRHATMRIAGDGNESTPDLQVWGQLVVMDSAQMLGTTTANARFESGSMYRHQSGPSGFVPLATWDAESTFVINGFTTSGYINLAHSDGWRQSFGHVIYDCPLQTVFIVDLNGHLNNIRGNLSVRSTNGRTLRLSTTQHANIRIGGSLTVEGSSVIWFSTNPVNSTIEIGGDFIHQPAITTPSYLTTRGKIDFIVRGDLVVNADGVFRLASATADSSGVREPTLHLAGNMTIMKGSLVAPPPGNGTVAISFEGSSRQRVSLHADAALSGNMHYSIKAGAIADLGTSTLRSDFGSLTVSGTLALGSTHNQGALQSTGNGNVNIPGAKLFSSGSSIEYNGTGQQVIGDGHPSRPDVDLTINSGHAVVVGKDLEIGTLHLMAGELNTERRRLEIHGDVIAAGDTQYTGTLNLVGDRLQRIDMAGISISVMEVFKHPDTQVNIVSPLAIGSRLIINSGGTTLNSNGNLTLLSVSDDGTGDAYVGPIPAGAHVRGPVTVERYMSGEGRIYRYLSSPVSHATVASLLDDFPVTGNFADASVGPGINTPAPSLFYYDESVGGLSAGWKPFPVGGQSSDHLLESGRGYAAFIRKRSDHTLIDLTGELNQGQIDLPVAYTPSSGAGRGWNLIGNPYASAISWGDEGWEKQAISEVITIRDNGAGGIHHYWDGDNGLGDLPGGRIASGQSFWVKALGPSASLTITETAKSAGSASFYRKRSSGIPTLRIAVSRGDLVDHLYLKLRPSSGKFIDRWDGEKLFNDSLNIYWMLDSLPPLAIHATNEIPCAEELGFHIDDLSAKQLLLSIETINGLEQYDIELYDRIEKLRHIMTRGMSIPVQSRGPGRTSHTDHPRFALIIRERRELATPGIIEPIRCYTDDHNALVSIRTTGPGFRYSLWQDGVAVSGVQFSSYSADTIRIDAANGDGNGASMNKPLYLHYSSYCHGRSMVIPVLPGLRLNVDDSLSVCAGQKLTLRATSEQRAVIGWYESMSERNAISFDELFQTPQLFESRSYFVEARTPEGCVTPRLPVRITVREPTPIVRMHQRLKFNSQGITNNPDFWMNHLKDDGDFQPAELGEVKFVTRESSNISDGCYTDQMLLPNFVRDSIQNNLHPDSITVLRDATQKLTPHTIKIYPNPGSDHIHIIGGDAGTTPLIYDQSGKMMNCNVVEEHESRVIVDVSRIPAGTYMVRILWQGRMINVRFVKISRGEE